MGNSRATSPPRGTPAVLGLPACGSDATRPAGEEAGSSFGRPAAEPSPASREGLDRRTVICGGCSALVAACTPPSYVAFPTGETGQIGGDSDDDGPTEDPYPCEQVVEPGGAGWTALPLAQYPDLAEVGGWYAVSAGGQQIVVAHPIEGCYSAIARPCAHEGALINYVPSRAQFVCPLHGAVYDLQGDKVAGPQATGLPVYACGRDGDTIWVRVT